jgi:hypothetical protein
MAVETGLAALRKRVEKAAEGGGEFEKAKWLSIKANQSVKVRFLQEIDADSPNYDPDKGLALIVSEISDPADFKKKCVSTLETEGKCYGTEMHNALRGTEGYNGGWKPKVRLYANVLVYPEDGTDPYVAILSQGVSGKSITPTLLEYAEDGITNKVFKIKRTGDGFNNTSYSLILLSTDTVPFDTEVELYDLRTVATREVPYAEQAAFFGHDGSSSPSATSVDTEW